MTLDWHMTFFPVFCFFSIFKKSNIRVVFLFVRAGFDFSLVLLLPYVSTNKFWVVKHKFSELQLLKLVHLEGMRPSCSSEEC